MKTFYTSCVFHWLIVTPVMSRSQFLHPGGGCKNGTKTQTGPDGPGGVWKPPPGGPPRGGGGYLNNRYFGGAYQGVGVKNFGPPGGVQNDPFWGTPQKRPFWHPPRNVHFLHTPWKTTKIHMLACWHVRCTSQSMTCDITRWCFLKKILQKYFLFNKILLHSEKYFNDLRRCWMMTKIYKKFFIKF